MTAHELAHKLLELPDLPVTVRGYESGVNIISEVKEPCPIHLDIHQEAYYGKHEYHKEENPYSCYWCRDWDDDATQRLEPPTNLAIHLY